MKEAESLWRFVSCCLAAALGLAGPAGAGIVPAGGEAVSAALTAGDQRAPDVAISGVLGFVVWQGPEPEDGDGLGIYLRRTSGGAALGPEAMVHLPIAGDQTAPAVAVDAVGNFVVAWQGPETGGSSGIYFRAFTAGGSPRMAVAHANAASPAEQTAPTVALLGGGEYLLVVWQSSTRDDGGEVFGRIFEPSGFPLTDEFVINATHDGDQVRPAVSAVPSFGDLDSFAVVWEGPDGAGSGIFGRHLSSHGALLGPEFQVNELAAGSQQHPAVAAGGFFSGGDRFGTIAVVWEAPDAAGRGIFLRRFDLDFAKFGGDFQVHADAHDLTEPDVAVDSVPGSTGIAVVWAEVIPSPLGEEALLGEQIYIRGSHLAAPPVPVVDASSLVAPAILLEPFEASTGGDLTSVPAVAVSPGGHFTILWQSEDQDGSGSGVFGRSFELLPVDAVFRDDFELGDVGRWSFSLP